LARGGGPRSRPATTRQRQRRDSSLEDETGIADLVVWPQVFEQFRRVVMNASMIAVRGRIQREGEVVLLVAHRSFIFSRVSDRRQPRRGFPAGMDAATKSPTPAAVPIRVRTAHTGLTPTRHLIPHLHTDIIKAKSPNFY
jgi:error-prone DNA polymerase